MSRTRLIALVVLAVAALAAAFVLLRPDAATEDRNQASGRDARTPPSARGGGGATGESGDSTVRTGATGSDRRAAETPARPPTPTVRVVDGAPVGGVEKVRVKRGGTIRLIVISDSADMVHLHGYDVERDAPAGRRVLLKVKANIAGVFEAELEHAGVTVAEIRVDP